MSITNIFSAEILSYLGTFVAPRDVVHLSETCTTMQKVFDTHEFWKNFSMQKYPFLKDKFQEFIPELQKFLFKTCLFPSEISKSDGVFKSKFSVWAKEKFSQEKLLLENQNQKLDRELQELDGDDSHDGQVHLARVQKENEHQKLLEIDPEHTLAIRVFNDAEQILGLLDQEFKKIEGVMNVEEISERIEAIQEGEEEQDDKFIKYDFSRGSSYEVIVNMIEEYFFDMQLCDSLMVVIILNDFYPELTQPTLERIDARLSKVLDQMYKVLIADQHLQLLENSKYEKESQRESNCKKLERLTEDSLIEELKKKINIRHMIYNSVDLCSFKLPAYYYPACDDINSLI
jgi:hypothetical protein